MARRGSATWWIQHYGKPCLEADHVRLEWYPGVTTIVHRGTEKVWQAIGAIMLAYGYKVPTSYTGSYKCRTKTSGSSWSGHAWPVAMDINAATNPYIRTPSLRKIRWGVDTDMPAAMVREIESILASGVVAVGWGGRWRTVKDAMHYQIHATLTEIAGGVTSPRGFYEGDEDMSMIIDALKAQDMAYYETLQQKTGSPGGNASYWGSDYTGAKPSDAEWAAAADELFSASLEAGVMTFSSGGGGKHGHPATATVVEGTKVSVVIGEAG